MLIEFDAAKNAANLLKHGVGLEQFAEMDVTVALIVSVMANGEAREVVIAPIAGRLYVGVITRRALVIRVISLRKANSRERKHYASAK